MSGETKKKSSVHLLEAFLSSLILVMSLMFISFYNSPEKKEEFISVPLYHVKDVIVANISSYRFIYGIYNGTFYKLFPSRQFPYLILNSSYIAIYLPCCGWDIILSPLDLEDVQKERIVITEKYKGYIVVKK